MLEGISDADMVCVFVVHYGTTIVIECRTKIPYRRAFWSPCSSLLWFVMNVDPRSRW